MGELILTSSRLAVSVASFTDALGLGLVVLAVGGAGALVAYAVARYSDVNIDIDLSAKDLIPLLGQSPT